LVDFLYIRVTIIPIIGVKNKDTQKAIKNPIGLFFPYNPTIRERPNEIIGIIISNLFIKEVPPSG